MLQASSTYEARSRARELKFLISPAISSAVVAWARIQLAPDPHGAGDHGDEYGITSLYFDTQALDVYHQRGSFGRGKYRARRYERATSFFLERKLRTERLLVKRRTEVDVGALEILANATRDAQWTGHWFRRRLDARGLRPTCQVSYRRVARVGETADGPLRLTCDREVCAREAPGFAFLPETGTDVLGPRLVLEMKFSAALPAIFKRLVEEFALEPLPVSKYRLSLDAIRRDATLDHLSPGSTRRRSISSMPDFLTLALVPGPTIKWEEVGLRLLAALLLGRVVAIVYTSTRPINERTPSFPTTLVLLSVLIAMVTQVIGDNVARAFSLVGALSIVRFRTVVRDTEDTAFVIFAVIVGMAIGGNNLPVALVGIAIVTLAAWWMKPRRLDGPGGAEYVLNLRVALGQNLNALVGPTLDAQLSDRRLLAVSTAKQGTALNASYQVRLKAGGSPDDLVKALNRLDGVQDVDIAAPREEAQE